MLCDQLGHFSALAVSTSRECQERCAGIMCQASKEVLAVWKAAQVRAVHLTLHWDYIHSLNTCADAGCLL